jgi:hypothetical protein
MYEVCNNGNVPVEITSLDDSVLGSIGEAVGMTLGIPGSGTECATFVRTDTAVEGEYSNLATVAVENVECGVGDDAEDPSGYFGALCEVSLEKLVNGEDADTLETAVEVEVGAPMTWTIEVCNLSNVPVVIVSLDDDVLGPIPEAAGVTLGVPGSGTDCATFTRTGVAEEGEHVNIATVIAANVECGIECPADDPSWYVGTPPGGQGCTPGYWKNHEEDWVGFSPGQPLGSVFTIPLLPDKKGDPVDLSGDSLMAALNYGGGPGVSDAAKISLRAAVAALLNASHPGIAYAIPFPGGVVGAVNGALATGDRDIILDLASELDDYNNAGCFDDMEMPD